MAGQRPGEGGGAAGSVSSFFFFSIYQIQDLNLNKFKLMDKLSKRIVIRNAYLSKSLSICRKIALVPAKFAAVVRHSLAISSKRPALNRLDYKQLQE